ncbi:MAG TPA: hypothetical protein PKC57_12240, partial [Microthrixaceae bacterium]|nr:hypothetical protein [Microthrixaceae bacterium]
SQGPAACVRPGGGEALWRFLIGAEYGGQVHVAADEGTYNVETLPGVQLSVEIDSPQFDQVYTFSAWTSGSLTVLGASPFRVSGGNLNASYGATPMFINFTADATE